MGTFSALEAITGLTYPEDDITVYTDQAAAYQAHALDVQMAHEFDPEKVDALATEHKVLVDKVKASALTFRLRGVPSEVRQALGRSVEAEFGVDVDTADSRQALAYDTLAAHIVHVTNARGDVDETRWDRDSIRRLLDGLHNESYPRFYDAMNKLTLQAAYFEGVEVSPDFS